MTFVTLSYLTWYKKHRNFVKEMVLQGDFAGALSTLETLIAEHEANMPIDHSTLTSELHHMKHAVKHIQQRGNTDTQRIKDKIPKILSYEPSTFEPRAA